MTGACAQIFGTDFSSPVDWCDPVLDDVYYPAAPFFFIFGNEDEDDIRISEENLRAMVEKSLPLNTGLSQ